MLLRNETRSFHRQRERASPRNLQVHLLSEPFATLLKTPLMEACVGRSLTICLSATQNNSCMASPDEEGSVEDDGYSDVTGLFITAAKGWLMKSLSVAT